MNRYQLRYFLCAILFTFFLAGCSKDDDDDNGISPNVALLTAGEWMGDAVYQNGEDVTEQIIEDYQYDITQVSSVFNRDGSYTDYFNGTPSADGDWEYQNNERVIVFDEGTEDEFIVVISKLDEDELFYVVGGYEFRFVR